MVGSLLIQITLEHTAYLKFFLKLPTPFLFYFFFIFYFTISTFFSYDTPVAIPIINNALDVIDFERTNGHHGHLACRIVEVPKR